MVTNGNITSQLYHELHQLEQLATNVTASFLILLFSQVFFHINMLYLKNKQQTSQKMTGHTFSFSM